MLRYYEPTIGIKTGFTKRSGRCLVSAAEKDGITLIVVTLNCGDDWNVHETLYERYFPAVEKKGITCPDTITLPVTGGKKSSINLISNEELHYIQEKNTPVKVENKQFTINFAYAPIKKGDILGKIVYYIDGEVCGEAPLMAEADVEKSPEPEKSWLDNIQNIFNDWLFKLEEII